MNLFTEFIIYFLRANGHTALEECEVPMLLTMQLRGWLFTQMNSDQFYLAWDSWSDGLNGGHNLFKTGGSAPLLNLYSHEIFG